MKLFTLILFLLLFLFKEYMRTVIILAAGSGSRMDLGYNKMLYRYKNTTILDHTLKTFVNSNIFDEIIIVKNSDDIIKYDEKIKIVNGGKTRQKSVIIGVQEAKNEYVYIHDGARTFINIDELKRLENALQNFQKINCYALAVRSKDTINYVENDCIKDVLKRENLYCMQTPQVIRREIYLEIISHTEKEYTDESSLMFANKQSVKIIEGSYENIKVTTKEDLNKFKLEIDKDD